VSRFVEGFLRQDGVFLLRLMTIASNALTTVDLTGALWSNYWKSHPPTSEVALAGGGAADQSAAATWFNDNSRRQSRDHASDDSTVKRKPVRDHQQQQLEPIADKA